MQRKTSRFIKTLFFKKYFFFNFFEPILKHVIKEMSFVESKKRHEWLVWKPAIARAVKSAAH